MIVTTPENYERTRARRFTVQGVKAAYRPSVMQLRPGDRICWYLVGGRGFVATADVTSPMFEDSLPIWISAGRPDTYPWRFRITRRVARDVEHAIPAPSIVDRLAFVRRWPPAHWPLAFQGNFHEIGRRDFGVIERALSA
jgi:hypothetical protein